MPLTRLPIPADLITLEQGGTVARLNRQRYEAFNRVEGEPGTATPDAARREAFAALHLANKLAPQGLGQCVYLGDAAVQFLYGRDKRATEQDCDVVARVLQGTSYCYLLGEGKGADILKATAQFETAIRLLAARTADAGPVNGAVVVMPRLRYLEWSGRPPRWVAYLDGVEEPRITARLQPNIARARPTLQPERVYLLDGPEDDQHRLPSWCINPTSAQPFTVYVHERRVGDRGQFRPLHIGQGPLQIYYVA